MHNERLNANSYYIRNITTKFQEHLIKSTLVMFNIVDFQDILGHLFEFYPFYPILGIFAKYGFFSKINITIRTIILGHFQPKLMTQFSSNVQKLHFWAILGNFFEFYPLVAKIG